MNKNQRIILIGLSAVEIALLLLVTFVKPFQFMGEPMSQLTGILLTRAAGGVLFAYLIYLMSIPVLKPFRMLSGVRWPDLILPCVPYTLESRIRMYKNGSDAQISINRWATRSTFPAKYPSQRPTRMAIAIEKHARSKPKRRLVRSAWIIRLATSRPIASLKSCLRI